MKKKQNLANATLREVWRWHSMSKTRKITGKIVFFQFCKLTFLGVSDQAICKFA